MKAFAVLLVVLLVAACGGSNAPVATLPPASATPGASPTATATTSLPPTIIASPTASPPATGTPNPEPTSTIIVPPPAPSPPLPVGDTGVAGVALIGPTCPVQRIDSPCPDRPWQGIVSARTTSGVEVAQAATDVNGAFAMHLAPGVYDIVTLTSGTLPAPVTQRVTVRAGEVTQVQLMLDSGIR